MIVQKIIYRIFQVFKSFKDNIEKEIIKSNFKKVGKEFQFSTDSIFIRPEKIEIGDNVFIGSNAHISSRGVKIGHNIMIGPNLLIEGDNHKFQIIGKRIYEKKHDRDIGEIIIEDNVWCGGNVTILKSVRIAIGTVVGANSLVNKSLPPYMICAGIPCKPIKKRFEDEDLKIHLIKLGYKKEFAENIIQERNNYFKTKILTNL